MTLIGGLASNRLSPLIPGSPMSIFFRMVAFFCDPTSAECQPYVRVTFPPLVVLYFTMYTNETIIYGSTETMYYGQPSEVMYY